MPDEVNYNGMTEEDFLKVIVARVQKHLNNAENTLPMLRNGQFIDAFYRVGASKEGLSSLLNISNQRLQYLLARNNPSENNTNK
jgi:hypothetical protein